LAEIGIVVGEARPERIQFLAKDVVRVGEFVRADTVDGKVLYLVESSKLESKLLSKVGDYITAVEAREASKVNPRDTVRYCTARAVGLVEEILKGRRVYPTLPPDPGTSVFLAEDELLKRIFYNNSKEWVDRKAVKERERYGFCKPEQGCFQTSRDTGRYGQRKVEPFGVDSKKDSREKRDDDNPRLSC